MTMGLERGNMKGFHVLWVSSSCPGVSYYCLVWVRMGSEDKESGQKSLPCPCREGDNLF